MASKDTMRRHHRRECILVLYAKPEVGLAHEGHQDLCRARRGMACVASVRRRVHTVNTNVLTS